MVGLGELQMINEPALKDALLALTEQTRSQYEMLSAATIEIASLREMLREAAGDNFSAAFQRHQAKQIARTALGDSVVLEGLSSIIQRLKDGEVC
jgi:hypothetical protein